MFCQWSVHGVVMTKQFRATLVLSSSPWKHRATRFLHLWWSLAILFAPFHITPKPCRSVNVICQVFCGLPLDILPSSGIQFMATFAGLSSVHLSTWQPVSSSMISLFLIEVSFQTFSSALCCSYGQSVIFPIFSHYTVDGKRSKVLWICAVSFHVSHEVLSTTWLKCRGRTWQYC